MTAIPRRVALTAAVLAVGGWAGPTSAETVLYTLGLRTNGGMPYAGLVADSHGALYGAADIGGIKDNGTIFRLNPPAGTQTAWTQTVLYRFSGSDGSHPQSSLIIDGQGALYGTTAGGGAVQGGVAFKLTPPAVGGTTWTETVLHDFSGVSDGVYPSGLIADSHGALYGQTAFGGGASSNCPSSCGLVFRLDPPAAGHSAWGETVLHVFTGGTDGAQSSGRLAFGGNGVLYGTTPVGGNAECSGNGCGIVFSLTPPAPGKIQWTETVLYRFQGGSDGATPVAGLIADRAGVMYGSTVQGGVGCRSNYYIGCGTVFGLAPPAAGQTAWTESVLYRFKGGSDGSFPNGLLTVDGRGTLYGPTLNGGDTLCHTGGCGTVFELTPPAAGQPAWTEPAWTETVLHRFTGGSDGGSPGQLLIADWGRTLLGTAATGAGTACGGYGCGTVFQLDIGGPGPGISAPTVPLVVK